MALSAELEKKGFLAKDLATTATVHFDLMNSKVADITLDLKAAAIDGLPEDQFVEIANGAKENCPISKLLVSVPISLNVVYGEMVSSS